MADATRVVLLHPGFVRTDMTVTTNNLKFIPHTQPTTSCPPIPTILTTTTTSHQSPTTNHQPPSPAPTSQDGRGLIDAEESVSGMVKAIEATGPEFRWVDFKAGVVPF